LDDFDKFSLNIPLLANIQPSGAHFMEDLYYAGGLPALMNQMKEYLHTDSITVNGKTIGENIIDTPIYDATIISSFAEPFKPDSGIAVVRGNLAPQGAVFKPSAASPELFKHRGKAVVFESRGLAFPKSNSTGIRKGQCSRSDCGNFKQAIGSYCGSG
jgi:dihydroxy-acid dehydratase